MSTAERNREMAQRYEAGETLQMIGDAFGVSRQRVRQILDAQGVSQYGYRGIPVADVVAAYESGLTQSEVAAQFGVCDATVHHRLTDAGVEICRSYRTYPYDPNATEKPCTGCGETKPLDAFPETAGMLDGRSSNCRACYNLRSKAHYRRRLALEMY